MFATGSAIDDSAPLTDLTARSRMDAAVRRVKAAAAHGDGRGIVICGGGAKYFTCAWVCINMLRRLGCALPVELWHLGADEMPPALRSLVEPLGVRCVDGAAMRVTRPARILNGWELKPYAIIHSAFREVLALDADNVPVIDPTYLFDAPEYAGCGAVFWPDYGRLARSRAAWSLTGVEYRDEPEFESGQIVVDKSRCAEPLSLTMWMNEHSDFWYRHVHGDKETFHLAWRKLDRPYAMPPYPIHTLGGTMCQHDFQGRRVFQHRNLRKWSLGSNPRTPGFDHEQECLAIVEQLRPYERALRGFPTFDPALSAPLAGRVVDYHRVGYDRRPISLEADGSIGSGGDRMERLWGVRVHHGVPALEIYGDDGITARLHRDRDDPSRWSGGWLVHERMALEVRVGEQPSKGDVDSGAPVQLKPLAG
ncbi:MAG TPA: hypothetical protein VF796_16425 [Humisphaera sp.]